MQCRSNGPGRSVACDRAWPTIPTGRAEVYVGRWAASPAVWESRDPYPLQNANFLYTFHMWRALRFAFVCLLAFALPLQGVTAATMAACGMAAGDSQATGMDHTSQHQGGAPKGDGHSHASGESHDHASHAHAAAQPSDEESSSSQESQSQKCSVCASCCVGTALPAEPLSFASVKLADHFARLVPRSVAAFVTEGLERPPRLFLA